jgi:hypothetical protein
MSERTELPDGVEEEFRAIAREEAEAVTEEKVTDGEGESGSLGQLVHDVGLTRRQALLAMFYMAGGAVASTAIVQAFSDTAEAAPSDDLTVPGTLTTEAVDTEFLHINDYSAELTKTNDQSINADNNTTLDWGSQDLDTDLYSYDTSTDGLTVLESGDYLIQSAVLTTGTTDGTEVGIFVNVNGNTNIRVREVVPGGTSSQQSLQIGGALKGLSANDTITIAVRFRGDSGTIVGSSFFDYATVVKGA